MLIVVRMVTALAAAQIAHVVIERPVAKWRTSRTNPTPVATGHCAALEVR